MYGYEKNICMIDLYLTQQGGNATLSCSISKFKYKIEKMDVFFILRNVTDIHLMNRLILNINSQTTLLGTPMNLLIHAII